MTFPPICVHYQAAASWALGQIGRHTAEHALAVAEANVLPRLLDLYLNPSSTEDLINKVSSIQQHEPSLS